MQYTGMVKTNKRKFKRRYGTRRFRSCAPRAKRRISKQTGGQEKTQFYFFNAYHYGDNILNLKFLYNISPILKEKNIFIHYYYDTNYVKNRDELDRYVNAETLSLHPLEEKPATAIQLWMGDDIGSTKHADFANYYNLFYRQILTYLGLQNLPIDTSLYQKEDYLLDIYNKLDPKFKDIDVLLLNNPPASGQFDFDKTAFDALANRLLSKKFKVVVLSPVGNIPSTNADGLSLQHIGAISTHAKYIIGTNTGALVPCFNIYTKKFVKKWIIFCKHGTTFNYIDAMILGKPEDVNTANTYIK